MPTPLARLLQSRMDEKGWKLRDVVRPPDGQRVGAPARSTLSQHLQPGYWLSTMPRPTTIRELAVAVRLPEEQIREAAWASLRDNRGLRGHLTLEGKGYVTQAEPSPDAPLSDLDESVLERKIREGLDAMEELRRRRG